MRLWLLPLLAAFLIASSCADYDGGGPQRVEVKASGVWDVGISGGKGF